jgi:leader peptidase (prepilin peptidase)/N-methyltransferase
LICGLWWLVLLIACTWAAVMDLRQGSLPLAVLAVTLLIGLAGSPFCLDRGFFWSLGGVLWGGGLPLAVAIVFRMVFGREGLGGGDVVLLACVGAYVGAVAVLFVLLLVCLTALAGGAAWRLVRGGPVRLRLAPFVWVAVVVYLIVGRILVCWSNCTSRISP